MFFVRFVTKNYLERAKYGALYCLSTHDDWSTAKHVEPVLLPL